MKAVLHMPDSNEAMLKINNEIASVYTRAAIDLINSLNLSPQEIDALLTDVCTSSVVKKIA